MNADSKFDKLVKEIKHKMHKLSETSIACAVGNKYYGTHEYLVIWDSTYKILNELLESVGVVYKKEG